MKFLVTGGAGFIGSHTVDLLIKLNHEVTVIDNESAVANEKFYWNEQASNYKLDIRNFNEIRPLFEGIKYVIHLAAQSRIQRSFDEPETTFSTNALGTLNVLECSRQAGAKRVVYASASSAYGNNELPNIETQPNECLNSYSVSKVIGEEMCKLYNDYHGLETVILRYFNVYGDRQPSRGEYATLLGALSEQARNGSESISIYGNGEQRRDFTHVDDVAYANILSSTAWPYLSGDKLGTVYNIGSGENYSINEIADLCGFNKNYLEARPGEAKNTLANFQKAHQAIHWAPTKSLERYLKNLVVEY